MKISMQSWKEVVGQLHVLRTYYARLSERERIIVLASVGAAIIFVMALIYSTLLATTSRMERRIEKSREYLTQIHKLRKEYQKTETQIQQFDQMIQRTSSGFQLGTHLERLAQRNGVSIDSLKDQPAPKNELYNETQVSVSVRQVTLRTLIDLLHEIENSRELLRITSIQVKPNFQDPTQLNAKFTVSTFSPVKS